MNLAEKILSIRKSVALTQEEFADRLFVTRQAVSRWENGETSPTLDTLRTIFELFNVDANSFFTDTEAAVCQSCAFPFKVIDEMGENSDKTLNADYCKYCLDGGKFVHEGSLDEMIEINLKFLTEFNAENGTNFSPDEARAILKQYLPTLKRWRKE